MYNLRQKYYSPQVRPDRGLNSWPPDHDSTFHVTETATLITRPSVTSWLVQWHEEDIQRTKLNLSPQ